MKRIAAYCGSQLGENENIQRCAEELGRCIAARQLDLVFGGYEKGLMGLVSKGAVDGQGHVIAVTIPLFTEGGHEHPEWETIVSKDLSERRRTMMDLSDGFIALPGGFGTLDELTEVMVEASLQMHHKPIGILNVDNFYTPFLEFRKAIQQNGFEEKGRRDALDATLVVSSDPSDLLDQMIAKQKQLVDTKL